MSKKRKTSSKASKIILFAISVFFIVISAMFLIRGLRYNSSNALLVSLFFMLFAIWAVIVYMLIINAWRNMRKI